ncbi:MAG TPA: hypothetical protein DCL41_11150 [Bdellovibrionales bacterium]|nr:hypothetical protein [Pseudobdellovibrionaceae bacterium]HAG92423.1 hypothetical protein [Bdellovibrionales bacterium]|tara:strand:+ start:1330 stop:1734 length:405 start_codon:yes stop_codon:yes gene_type:complete
MPFELNLHNFLWAQGILLLFGLAFLLWKPKQRRGLQLRFDRSSKAQSPAALDHDSSGQILPFEKKAGERSLQVHFNFNGHSFEAYESLGLPAGSSLAAVQSAYEEQKKQANNQSSAFLEAAYEALNSTLKSTKN